MYVRQVWPALHTRDEIRQQPQHHDDYDADQEISGVL